MQPLAQLIESQLLSDNDFRALDDNGDCESECTGETYQSQAPQAGPSRTRRATRLLLGSNAAYVATVFDLADRRRLARHANLLTLRYRLASCRRGMQREGILILGRFAWLPSIDNPTFIYEMGTAASRYAEAKLLPAPASRVRQLLRKVLALWCGCDPGVGGIAIVGRRQ